MSVKHVFLQQTDNFINELSNIFPNNGEITLLKEKYFLIRSANSKLILEYFVQFVFPFKNQIVNQDEKFFLLGGGQEEIKHTSGLKFRDNIKNLWINKMSDENKEIIWQYFKMFIILSEKYILENMKK